MKLPERITTASELTMRVAVTINSLIDYLEHDKKNYHCECCGYNGYADPVELKPINKPKEEVVDKGLTERSCNNCGSPLINGIPNRGMCNHIPNPCGQWQPIPTPVRVEDLTSWKKPLPAMPIQKVDETSTLRSALEEARECPCGWCEADHDAYSQDFYTKVYTLKEPWDAYAKDEVDKKINLYEQAIKELQDENAAFKSRINELIDSGVKVMANIINKEFPGGVK